MSKRDLVIAEFARAGVQPGMYVRRSNFRAEDAEKNTETGTSVSYPWVLATEQPVEVFDWQMCEFWPEVLLIDGMEPVDSVPLLDNHRRNSVADILGSVRNMVVSQSGGYRSVDGDVVFSAASDVADAEKKVSEGHITDGSIGYTYGDGDAVYIGEDTEVTIKGKKYTGPVKVVTRWWRMEFSLTPIGADTLAKVKDILGI
jgi:hypothetical protein